MLSAIWLRRFQYLFIAIVTISVGFSLYQWNASRASTQKTAPGNGLVGYWSMNEGTGTSAGDASGNNNTGTLTGGPTWANGKLGKAVSFNGSSDYITMGDQASLEINNNSLSFGGWFYLNAYPAVNNRMFLITKGGTGLYYEYEMTVSGYSTNHLTVSLFNTAIGNYLIATSTTVPPLNTWFHVMGVWDKDAPFVKLYYNGVLESTNSSTVGAIHTTRDANFEIGRRGDNAEAKLNGLADDVRVYNRALSATEIMNFSNTAKLNVSPVSNLTSGLVGYWTFDGKDTPWSSSSAGTATDRSGNSNTGTLTNMSQSTSPTIGKLGQALNFDGVDDYVTTANTTAFDNLFSSGVTFCTWAKFPNFSNYNRLITLENNAGTDYDTWIQAQQSSAVVQFGSGAGNYKFGTTALLANTWYHLCGITDYTAGGTKIFVNGVDDGGSLGGTPTYTADKGRLDIGRLFFASSSYYGTGLIDEVRIYNRALSSTEIQSLYDLGASDKVNSSVSQNQGTGRLDSGLVGYWKLDDASGTTATDSSTNANNGTLTNMEDPGDWVTGQIGNALDFDGTDEYITVADPASGVLDIPDTSSFSLSGWFNRDTFTSDHTILAKRNGQTAGDTGYLLYIDDATDDLIFEVSDGTDAYSRSSTSTFTATGWNHFAVTFSDTSGMSVFINGTLNQDASSGTLGNINSLANALAFRVGSESDAGSPFDGKLDDLHIYNRTLSADEISQLYRLTAPTGVDTSLKGYWSFDGPATNWTSGSAGTVSDLSGIGNTGTLTNMSQSTSPIIGKLGQALNFDGVNDWVDVGDMPSIEGQETVTISAWVKPNALVDFASVASKYVSSTSDLTLNEGGTGVGSNSGFIASIRNGSDTYGYTGSGKLSVGTWSFVSMVFDGSQTGNANRLKIYVNGVNETLTFNGTIPASIISNSQNLLIGRTGSAFTYFNGSIDEVRIYTRVLSSTEISALYNSGR